MYLDLDYYSRVVYNRLLFGGLEVSLANFPVQSDTKVGKFSVLISVKLSVLTFFF